MKRIKLWAIVTIFIALGVLFFDSTNSIDSSTHQESTQSSLPTSPPANTANDTKIIVPGGGLIAHERAGGHLIARHVGRTKQQLIERVNSGAVRTASSFFNQDIAERAVAQAIIVNQAKIDHYLRSYQHKYLEITYRSPSPVGYSFSSGGHSVTTVHGVKVIISQDKTMPIKYKIITGYPTP